MFANEHGVWPYDPEEPDWRPPPRHVDFPERWVVSYLSEYDRLVVPVLGRPDDCPNPRCYSRYGHNSFCDEIPF